MYLKALEIQGFKSFPDKTRLTFEKDITAIVGPNGSGKSNISDAILWVMGEQRSKALRGSKMEDVIFGGTEKRNAMGFAQVSLVIDNSAHIFDSDSSEIMLTRRYYRSGESEYYINRQQVRLKDINSLLMDTGLGRDGYSIIGQGRIAEIVSSKSTDRREVFEEAAGISRFRYRKEEAERKLEKTEENLVRINDKIDELELQVGPLKKQAEVAKKYLVLREDLRVREISAWMASLDKLHAQAESIRLEYKQASAELERAKSELEALYASSDSITERMHRKDEESEEARERLRAAEAASAATEAEAAVLRANEESAKANKQRLLDDIAAQESRSREIRSGIRQAEDRINEILESLRELAEEQSKNDNVLSGCRIKLQSREQKVAQLTQKANALEVDGRSMDARIRMLSDMERDFEGYSRAVKTVMREKTRGTLRGIHAPVANLVRADEECALAIETALGGNSQHIVVDTQNDAKAAIELLKRLDAGRATFQPIDTIRGTVIRDLPERDPGFVGLAFDLVSYEPQYKEIVARFLGRTLVAETLTDAIRISRSTGARYSVVTLDGQVVNAGGSLTGGSSAHNSGFLSRANELDKLKKQREKLEIDEQRCKKDLQTAQSDLAGVRYQLDMAMEDHASLLSSQSSLEAEKKTTENTISQFNALLESLSGDSAQRRASVEAADRQIAGFARQLAEKEEQLDKQRAARDAILAEIDTISRSKLELEGKRTRTDKDLQAHNTEILDLERQTSRIEQRKTAAEMEEKQIVDKLWDNYELSHSAAQALRQPVDNLQRANKEIADLRRQMSQLGTPNLGAIEEYERVNSRYEFLTEQRDDVEKARKDLLDIISEITGQMRDVFLTRFKEIDECFRRTFLELFGGGKAALRLEDENNVLECGIEIKVQPPGKALSNISLLSGGEMAFVAIALYFAILTVRPTPFCVMDEIEAALDEANVVRYADYMRRMSDKTQFLVITHRRGTMEEADMLYGVTMQEKGVSTVIELDLDAAQKTIES